MTFPTTRVLSLAGLVPGLDAPWGSTPRDAIAWAASLGVRGLVIDGMRDGIRARQLDASARRGLASVLNGHDLMFAGIDLWIPAADFADAVRSERAIDAVCDALVLAADVYRASSGKSGGSKGSGSQGSGKGLAPCVNILLPARIDHAAPQGNGSGSNTSSASNSAARLATSADAHKAIAYAAEHVGTRVADHAVSAVVYEVAVAPSASADSIENASTTSKASAPVIAAALFAQRDPAGPVGVGIDPLVLLRAMVDPSRAVSRAIGPIHAARLFSSAMLSSAAGSLAFDIFSYRAALLARNIGPVPTQFHSEESGKDAGQSPLIIDLRGEPKPEVVAMKLLNEPGEKP